MRHNLTDSVLNKTGNGDGFFSSLFQTTLEGNKLQNATCAGEVIFYKIKWAVKEKNLFVYLLLV